MENWFEQVKDFHKTFNHPVAEGPKDIGVSRAMDRYKWMYEELEEFIEGARSGNITEQADAMIDLIYFALGTLVEIGVKPEKLFQLVHSANMAKVHADGTVKYHLDGKVKKPDGWVAPDEAIEAEIKKQIEEANNEAV